jgi:hypothetical protein
MPVSECVTQTVEFVAEGAVALPNETCGTMPPGGSRDWMRTRLWNITRSKSCWLATR